MKNKLLKCIDFEDNEYLEKYLEIISNPGLEDGYTEKHHIIPRCYYRLHNLTINNSPENLVTLTMKNHMLAHYYLMNCVNKHSQLYQKLVFACNRTFNNNHMNLISEDDAIMFANILSTEIKRNLSALMIGNTNALGYKFTDEQRLISSQSKKGRVITDLTKDKISKAHLMRNLKWMHKSDTYCLIPSNEIDKYLQDGWLLGGRKLSDEHKRKISLANKGSKRSLEARKKMSEKALGREAWNKGIPMSDKSKLKVSQSKSLENKKWYTNGETELYLSEDENIPEGFVLGRKQFSEDTKAKLSAYMKGKPARNKGKICITNGEKNKYIFLEDFNCWQELGWQIKKKN